MLDLVIQYLVNNFIMIFALAGLCVLMLGKSASGLRSSGPIIAITIVLMVLSVADFLEQWAATWDHSSMLRVSMSVLGYSLRPVTILALARAIGVSKRPFKVLLALVIINCLVYCTGFFTDIAFSFTPDNGFVRGPLNYTGAAVSFVCLCALAAQTINTFSSGARGEGGLIILSVVACCIASFYELFGYARNLLNPTIAVCCLLYYFYLHIQVSKRDDTTGLLNRKSFFADVKGRQDAITALIVADMNGLKAINDTQGHSAGDDALAKVGKAFTFFADSKRRIYRMGGDEFIVMFLNVSKQDAQATLDRMRKKIEDTDYSCAFGLAFRKPGQKLESLMIEADHAMYADKERHYSITSNDRRKR